LPFEVPGSWVWTRVGEIAFLKAGSFVKAEDIKNECQSNLFPCYGGNGIRGYVETFTHEGLYSLIGRQGALCGNINIAQGKFHATEHDVVTVPYGNINSLWFFYTLRTLNLNQYSTGAAQPGLSVERINKVLIPVPPLQEQFRIFAKIEEIFTLIDQIEESKLSLSQFIKKTKSKALDLAIRGKLVPQDPNDKPASVLLEKIRNNQKKIKSSSDISHYQKLMRKCTNYLTIILFFA
jgi:type I restriction enzyme S subunit